MLNASETFPRFFLSCFSSIQIARLVAVRDGGDELEDDEEIKIQDYAKSNAIKLIFQRM